MRHATSPEPVDAAPSPGFWCSVRATSARWGSALLVAAASTYWLALVWDAQRLVQGVSWLVVGLVIVPLGFALGLGMAAAVLTTGLSLLSLPAWLLGRPTGLAGVLADLWRLCGHVLPGYWQALRRVRQPGLWGLVAGAFVGIVLFAWLQGLRR